MNDYRPGTRVLITRGHELAGQYGRITDAGTDKHIVTLDGGDEHAIGADQLLPVRAPKDQVQIQRAALHLDLPDDLLAGLAVRAHHGEVTP